jgi:hypothetical protein
MEMKLKALGLTAVAVSVAALVAACGGGGGDGAAATSGVQLSGVAATGLALASSPVDVKCASGSGTATTNESGGYTVTVTDGALPCIVKVTGIVNGVEVTLHSLAQAGTADGSTTTATANVTPLTEMILARAAGTLPSDLFANFGAGTAVTSETLTQASTDILAALSTAAGVDLTGIDPFKATLIAATPSNLSGGNDYDKLLDQLGTVVNTATLAQVVSQIASTTGSSAPVTLDEVVANVSKGSLAGCPQALSGKYRVIDYDGASQVIDLDFGTMKINGALDIVRNTSQNCEFSVNDTENEVSSTVVIGPTGAGVVRDSRILAYMFPVQSTALSAVVGRKWEFIESGIDDLTGAPNQWVGEMTFDAAGKATVCDYQDLDFSTCVTDNDEAVSLTQSGSTLLLNYGDATSPVYGFRAPNGTLTVVGWTHTTEGLRTSFVLSQPQAVPAQSVGTQVRYWNIVQRFNPAREEMTPPQDALFTDFSTGSLTITGATADSVTRTFANGTSDSWQLNQPISGLRKRESPLTYQRVIPGLGITIGIDGGPAHTLSLSVGRPE